MNKDHPLADRSTLAISDLKNEVVYSLEEGPQDQMFHTINDILASSGAAMFFPTLNSFFEGVAIAAAGNGIAVVPKTGHISAEYCISVELEYPQKYYLGLFISRNPASDIQEFCAMAKEICKEDRRPPIIV